MLNFTTEEIKDAYQKVNPKIQEVLNADWISEEIMILSRSVNMRVDQVSELIKLIGFVFLQLIPLSKLIEYIESELEVDNDKAIEIAEKVDQIIFEKVRTEIYKSRGETQSSQQEITEEAILDNKDALRDSLLKEIEDYSDEDSATEQTTNKLKEVVSNNLKEKAIDPYREQI